MFDCERIIMCCRGPYPVVPGQDGYIGKFLKKADTTLQEGVKKADEVLADAVEVGTITAKQAAKTGKKLSQQALKEEAKLQKKAAKKIESSLKSAKSMGSDPMREMEVLEKLDQLREKGIITDREFQAKKRKIMERI